MPIAIIRAGDCPLEAVQLGPGYSGPETYRAGGDAGTSDGTLELGVWSYDGTLVSTNPGQRHQLWAVLEGRLSVELEGVTVEAAPGDVVVLEAPYGDKTVHASRDFRAIWISAGQGAAS